MAEEFYGKRTADDILDDMLAGVRDDVDKREGSVVYDMLAPAAFEFEMLGYELDAIFALGFADTSEGDYLTRRAAELGVVRKQAVAAVGTVTLAGTAGTQVPAGFTVYTTGPAPVSFRTNAAATLGANGKVDVAATAVEGGIAGNVGPGAITAFENVVAGVTGVSNAAAFIGGVDTESDADLLARYLLKVRKPITSGNVYHYEKWATDVEGVSAAKVFPEHAGPGTVKVVVIDAQGRAPALTVVDAVTASIERERPVGAKVTVVPVTELPINVSASLTLAGDLTPANVLPAIRANIAAYLLAEAGSGVVRLHRVGEAILATNGVVDYGNLTLNGGTANVTVGADAVAIVGEVVLT